MPKEPVSTQLQLGNDADKRVGLKESHRGHEFPKLTDVQIRVMRKNRDNSKKTGLHLNSPRCETQVEKRFMHIPRYLCSAVTGVQDRPRRQAAKASQYLGVSGSGRNGALNSAFLPGPALHFIHVIQGRKYLLQR